MSEPDRAIGKQTELRHVLRSVRSALELGIVGRAPADLLNRLGRVAGLLDAVIELSIDAPSADAPSANALVPDLIADAHAALERWDAWERGRAASA